VTERSIEAYHDPRYRIGIYRLQGSTDQIEKRIKAGRAQVGKPYAFRKVLWVGVRMLVGVWRVKSRREVTPNALIFTFNPQLIAVV
jgi:hypothetical protein